MEDYGDNLCHILSHLIVKNAGIFCMHWLIYVFVLYIFLFCVFYVLFVYVFVPKGKIKTQMSVDGKPKPVSLPLSDFEVNVTSLGIDF